jgi:hypothetical protein
MWESWRTDLSFVLVGAILLVCQSLSGGVTDPRAEGAAAAPGDRSYRDTWRDETSGRGGMALPGDSLDQAAQDPAGPREDRQTN